MKITHVLPYVLVKLTGHGRYLPKIEWSNNSWVHNIFRVYEVIFWRKTGIRAEAATWLLDDKTVKVELYTFEAVCAHFETLIRNFFNIKWLDITVTQLQLALPVNSPQIRVPWISFAIALDVANASGDNSSSPFTFSHTSTGSNRFMHVGTRNWGGDQPQVTAVSYNSVAATEAIAITRTGQNFNESSIWFLGGPASGANTVSVTATLGQFGHGIAGCVTYTGAQSTNTADATGTASTATSGAFTATVTTVAANCWVAAAAFNDTDGSNQATLSSPTHTSRWNTQVPNEVGAGQDTNGAVAAGTGVNIGWTKNLSSAAGICGASFAPAAGGGAVAAIGGPAMPIPVNQNINELQLA